MFSVTRVLAAFVLSISLAVPSLASAASLTPSQVGAIVGLLSAFGVESSIIAHVEQILDPASAPVSSTTPSDPPAQPLHTPPSDSIYPSSSVGYDISFATTAYPVPPFGFTAIGITNGKAFAYNPRFASEYSWARLAASVAPSLYLNLNGPYGSTATSAHLSSPKNCDALFNGTTSAPSVGKGTFNEPSVCASYNYGYNTAKDAYARVKAAVYGTPFWWLDIEEANSWSANTAVNDAVVQGALDYLNSQGVHAGIYSTPRMWKNIAGASFSPTETINGKTISVPTWYPIGIADLIGALNSCNATSSFISGSPIWIIQYEADSTAVDQNIAC